MIDRGHSPRFLLETSHAFGIGGDGLGKNLDRDRAV